MTISLSGADWLSMFGHFLWMSLLSVGGPITTAADMHRFLVERQAWLADPQFSGQTKERLSSRACATFVSGVIKDAFSLWLNQHVGEGEAIAQLAIANAQTRMKSAR